ncbi:MAG: hypothetical protein BWY09_00894 [Candidatus Hydrogenedentes bacterium ADurb.Bin179]|nr:MAG: hypothetical protein BWY09_00894 [Candidatus Hydrogenedentes bacterium ADurb.Bin179]
MIEVDAGGGDSVEGFHHSTRPAALGITPCRIRMAYVAGARIMDGGVTAAAQSTRPAAQAFRRLQCPGQQKGLTTGFVQDSFHQISQDKAGGSQKGKGRIESAFPVSNECFDAAGVRAVHGGTVMYGLEEKGEGFHSERRVMQQLVHVIQDIGL